MKQFIIKLPEGTKSEDFSDEMKDAVKSVNGIFPSGAVVGSHLLDGYEIKLIMANANGDALTNLFSLLSLDWEVLAEEGELSDEDLILPFLSDVVFFDEEGDELSSQPQTIEALQTYAGHGWIF